MGAGLTLHPVGLNEEERKILSVAMNVLLACGCGVRCSEQLTGDTVAVIDVDSEEGRSFYEQECGMHAHRTVVIAGDDHTYRADGLIRKPLRVQTLRNLLSELSEQGGLESAPQPAVDVAPPVAHQAEPGSLPNSSLFYAMVNAVANEQFLKVICTGHQHHILIHGPTRHVYTNMTRQELEAAVTLGADDLDVSTLDEFTFMKLARGGRSCRIEKLLWLADEGGSQGHPPVHYDRQAGFHLTDWPRFDVEHLKPEYLTLTAIMTRQTLTPESLARITGIGLAKVFDFYHAARACGLVDMRTQHFTGEVLQPPPVRSLVTRIAKKLGLSFF